MSVHHPLQHKFLPILYCEGTSTWKHRPVKRGLLPNLPGIMGDRVVLRWTREGMENKANAFVNEWASGLFLVITYRLSQLTLNPHLHRHERDSILGLFCPVYMSMSSREVHAMCLRGPDSSMLEEGPRGSWCVHCRGAHTYRFNSRGPDHKKAGHMLPQWGDAKLTFQLGSACALDLMVFDLISFSTCH